jgi:hypothetical protein
VNCFIVAAAVGWHVQRLCRQSLCAWPLLAYAHANEPEKRTEREENEETACMSKGRGTLNKGGRYNLSMAALAGVEQEQDLRHFHWRP